MKLDTNTNPHGLGKYALLNLRKIESLTPEIREALNLLNRLNILEWGVKGAPDEFFVMKLRDTNTSAGLIAYAAKAKETDPEWAQEVLELAKRSSHNSPYCKLPD